MVGDDVDDNPQFESMGTSDEIVKVGEVSVNRINSGVIAHVVTVVETRGRKERSDPDRIHAEPGEVIEAIGDPPQIADPVTVAVGKGPYVHLVPDSAHPPGMVGAVVGRAAGDGGLPSFESEQR